MSTPPNTELALSQAAIDALMGQAVNFQYRAAGHYSHQTRRVELDFGPLDVGPVIGHGGSMKLAIQTVLACPFGGDACQLVIKTTREQSIPDKSTADESRLDERVNGFLKAMQDHYPPGQFRFSTERSASAIVVLVEATSIYVDQLRGPMSKILRSIGRRHGTVAVVSIEKIERHAAK